MNDKNIVIYTQPGCSACNSAKRFLSQKGIDFEEKDIRQDPQALKELTEKYNSRSTPTILLDDEVIIGFKKDKLEKELELQ